MNGSQIAKINYRIVSDIKEELRRQGHYLTGDLERSFALRQSNTDADVYLEAYAYAFIEELEHGVAAKDIPELNVNSKEFANLVYWVGLRGFVGNHFIIAKNIWKAWQEKGKPLDSSKEFSETGETLNAIETVFQRHDDDYFNAIDTEAVLTIDQKFFKE